MGTAMPRTHASEPWKFGKTFPIEVRLRMAQSSSGLSVNVDRMSRFQCLQMIHEHVQKTKLATAAFSSPHLRPETTAYRNLLPRLVNFFSCVIYNVKALGAQHVHCHCKHHSSRGHMAHSTPAFLCPRAYPFCSFCIILPPRHVSRTKDAAHS